MRPSGLPNVVLVGLPGAGKTTIGREAAKRLGWPFIDLDLEIERRAGLAVSEVFARYGEPGFRAMERDLTVELASRNGTMMAAGGGWATNADCMALLRPSSRIIYLRVAPSVALARIAADGGVRPMLESPNPAEVMNRLLEKRRTSYESADLVIDTEVIDTEALIVAVVRYAAGLLPMDVQACSPPLP